MAVNAISAARISRRNRYNTTRISTAAIVKECSRSPRARSNEIRRAVQGGIHGDALRLQGGREVRQGLFDCQGGRQGICTELTRERQHDAGFAHDQRVARAQRRTLLTSATSRTSTGTALRTR